MAVAEVPADRRAADPFPIDDRVRSFVARRDRSVGECEQRSALGVHRTKRITQIVQDFGLFLPQFFSKCTWGKLVIVITFFSIASCADFVRNHSAESPLPA